MFNNMILNPALTSMDGTNPGFSMFDYDMTKKKIHNLKMHYLLINQTFNLTGPLPHISNPIYKFQSIDYGKKYGVRTLDQESLNKFVDRLENGGYDQLIEYLTDRSGFNKDQKAQVIKIYKDDKLIGDEFTNVRLICVMSEGLTSGEVSGCIERKMKEI